MLRMWMRWHLLLLAMAGASGGVVAAEQLEYAVKAAYLAKFASYVDWPPAAFATPTSPVVLCVVGEDPFGPLLDEAAAGQQVSGRAIVVRRLKSIGRDAGCHIAYLGKDAHADDLRGTGTLVVADSGNGIINFVVKDNRVRFTVDDDAAAKNGLAISSKLLNVALSVKSRSPQ
ncbi:MAG TPA: YfiR family protein [Albitalea sp.]|nr:YfiR family protein [Albitalea sp.]